MNTDKSKESEPINIKTEDYLPLSFDKLNITETDTLLESIKDKEISYEEEYLTANDVADIKRHVLRQIKNTTSDSEISVRSTYKKQLFKRRGFLLTAAAVLFLLLINTDHVVKAVKSIFGIVPNQGIITEDDDILYLLKEPVSIHNENGTLSVVNAVANNEEITVNFIYRDTSDQSEVKDGKLPKDSVYLKLREETLFSSSYVMSSGGINEEIFYCTFHPNKSTMNTTDSYTLCYESYGLSVDFMLSDLVTVRTLEELGPTQVHNKISLTAVAKQTESFLDVTLYPINQSQYRLAYPYNLTGITAYADTLLLTDQGEKLPITDNNGGLAGSVTTYRFDISDGSKDLILHIPHIIVESNETKKMKLPIPNSNDAIAINETIVFEQGSVTITEVQKVSQSFDQESLLITLEYPKETSNLLYHMKFLQGSGAWSEFYDDTHRLKQVEISLEGIKKKNITFDIHSVLYRFEEDYDFHL